VAFSDKKKFHPVKQLDQLEQGVIIVDNIPEAVTKLFHFDKIERKRSKLPILSHISQKP
jgi:hypothetical protein